jgi:leader peptidase (prepilin peptidase)/N-methyltransferase
MDLALGAVESLSRILSGSAFVIFALAGYWLSVIDVRIHRLPDVIVLPSLAIIAGLFVLSALLVNDWRHAVQTLCGGAVLCSGALLIALAHPSGLGGGDVKLAALIGVVLGWMGWNAFAVGVFAGATLGALWSLWLICVRRTSWSSSIPFGPCLVGGAWMGIFSG